MDGYTRDVVFGSMEDPEATSARVSTTLGIEMLARDSLHMGGGYHLGHLKDGSEVRVRPNVDLLDDVPEITGWQGPAFVEMDARSDAGRQAVERLRAAGFHRIPGDR